MRWGIIPDLGIYRRVQQGCDPGAEKFLCHSWKKGKLEGVSDLIYRLDGHLDADYKDGSYFNGEAEGRARHYTQQRDYRAAAERA